MVLGRNNNNLLQAFFYFTPSYLFGITCAMKMLSCFVFLYLFRRLSSLSCSWLDKTMSFIAEFSFSIYFYHVFFVKIFYDFNIKGDTMTMACISGLVVTPVVISVCLLIAWSLKKLIGKNSKMYIGS